MDFEELASRYDRWFETPLGSYVDAWEKRLTWELAAPRSGERVLDVGAGTALYLLELAERGLQCTGLDISPLMMRAARGKAERRGVHLDMVMGSGDRLPFKNDSFDLVLSVTALEFFKSPERAAAEMVRVCRRGGRVVVGVLNRWSPWAIRRRILGLFRKTIFSECRFYSPPELRRLFGARKTFAAVYAPPGCPPRFLPCFQRLEPLCEKWLSPLGAYIAVRVDV